MRRFALLLTLALLTSACGSDGAVGAAHLKDVVPPAKYPTHFAGLPPEGAHASTPVTGKLVLRFNASHTIGSSAPVLSWSVYTDG